MDDGDDLSDHLPLVMKLALCVTAGGNSNADARSRPEANIPRLCWDKADLNTL